MDYIKAVRWSFGGWLLNVFVIPENLHRDFLDCDSLFRRVCEHLRTCGVFLRPAKIARIMSTLGHSSPIWAHRAQAHGMLSSHDAKGSIQMDMCSLGVVDLDLSSTPDRQIYGSTPCELRLMLPDSTMGSDGFHDIMIENLAATPAWWSTDMTALHRRWPWAVFRTMNRHGPDMERLHCGAQHQPDRAFRHNAPGF